MSARAAPIERQNKIRTNPEVNDKLTVGIEFSGVQFPLGFEAEILASIVTARRRNK